jgi:hypothetical protein
MKTHYWLFASLFLLVSCKQEVAVNQVNQKAVPDQVATAEDNIQTVLTRKTNLIGKVVHFQESQLTKGVTSTKFAYVDKDGLPMVLFFFRVDLNEKELTLKPLMPNGEQKFAMQCIPDMVLNNKYVGLRVLGAVNSDFFKMRTGEPRSILYLNGQAVRTVLPETRSYFGLTQIGKPLIGDQSVFAKQRSSIYDALGGYQRLIKAGLKVSQTDLSVHPRTAVGFTANNIVYFLVADGRNSAYSNGLTLGQVAEIMSALEIKEAINLDGGGSSTFVTNVPTLEVKNKPSDGSPRKVANGWAICIKE